MNARRMAIIPGDGTGRDVVPEGLRGREAAARRRPQKHLAAAAESNGMSMSMAGSGAAS